MGRCHTACHARSSSHGAIRCLANVVIAWHALQKLALGVCGDGELIDLSGTDSWPWKKQQRVGSKARCKETGVNGGSRDLYQSALLRSATVRRRPC